MGGAFTGTSIEHAVVKGNKCKIKDKAFSDCTKLKLVDIYPQVWTISTGAFSGCINFEASRFKYPPKKAKKLRNTPAVMKRF